MGTKHRVSWDALDGRSRGYFEAIYPAPITNPDDLDMTQIQDYLNASAGFNVGPIRITALQPTRPM